MVRIGIVCVAVLVAAWGLATPVDAYLDPGTGNALLQGIIGSVAVATGFLAYHWRRLRLFLSQRREADPAAKGPRGE